MKKITAMAAMLISYLPLMSWAADTVTELESYHYGQALDIKEVISVNTVQPENSCGVQKKELIYKDSQGQEHKLTYEAVPSGCNNS